MPNVDEFLKYILEPATRLAPKAILAPAASDVLNFFDGPLDETESSVEDAREAPQSFARYLLPLIFGSGGAPWPLHEGANALLPPVDVKGLEAFFPSHALVWDRHTTNSGPLYVVLVEFVGVGATELLRRAGGLFRGVMRQDRFEDAFTRVADTVLDGLARRTATKRAGAIVVKPEKTLCVVSVKDDRPGTKDRWLVLFATRNEETGGLETFRLHEEIRDWDPGLAREHLTALFNRSFSLLPKREWQNAFTTTDEREKAVKLLEACMEKTPTTSDIQEKVLDLLNTVAEGFGLRKKIKGRESLQVDPLPADHDIGIDAEERNSAFHGKNPFGGIALRDDKSRLLGYVVYPLRDKSDAARLRKHLAENNRFHNVLVIYPDREQATLELWQGRDQLTGKLRKGQGHKDAADVVNLLSRFFVVSKAKVRNPSELAQELAYRARYLRRLAVKQLEEEKEKGPLRTLYSEFKKALVHDQTEEEFADAFAQTLTYSLLTARWVLSAQGGAAGDRFTRKAAMQRLSIGSRFLGEMFNAVLEMKVEDRTRLLWLVDDVADLLDRVDVVEVFAPESDSDETDLTRDPVVHFYEPFLHAYDPTIRMQRGAFYTPQPVVSYIVRSVHELLQTEFGLADGLADTTTWGVMVKRRPELKLPPLSDAPGEKRAISADEPFVQILDPATGTGTFLVEVIEVIHRALVAKWRQQRLNDEEQRAAWNEYVPKHLLPRLHAFELMMAPYAIAHMKIGLKLAETGYRFGSEERARIYLTNALEPWVRQLPLIGFDALADEASAVNNVKRHTRFTVVIGNPPYSKISSNLTPAMRATVERYRYLDGERIKERGALQFEMNLQDDYVKFFRLCERTIHVSHVGVLGLITNNGYLSTPTLRGMRDSLLETFDSVWVLDLHGHVARGELGPDGAEEENVFDIVQGVSVFMGKRTHSDNGDSAVLHAERYGSRSGKYSFLQTHDCASTSFAEISPASPFYLFVPHDAALALEWKQCAGLAELFPKNSAGIITARDGLVIAEDRRELAARLERFSQASGSDDSIYEEFGFSESKRFDLRGAQAELRKLRSFSAPIRRMLHRPFDERFVFFSRSVVWSLSRPMADQMADGRNLALVATRQVTRPQFEHVFVSRHIIEIKACSHDRNTQIFPLFINDSNDALGLSSGAAPNIDQSVLAKLADALGLRLNCGTRELGRDSEITPLSFFYFAYAILHCPSYRDRYFEFLRSDFPRVPLTGDRALFRALSGLGGELTALHLLESPRLGQPTTEFIGGQKPVVERVSWSKNTVWVDRAKTSGFQGVREDVWNFRVGGYQVCEKWLRDRGPKRGDPGRALSKDDLAHYQKIVVAISETIRIMQEIDGLIDEHGGWPGAFMATPRAASE